MGLNIKDLAVSSPDFAFGERIPDAHSGAAGTPPELEITGVPEGAVELAVIAHDPDAPLPQGFTHWTVYGIAPADGRLDTGSGTVREGPNGIGAPGYTGPQPPPGHGIHHYYFWVYALSAAVAGEPTREEFLARYADRIIEQNRVVGTYSA
ncbi:YbhB/YbcL family Raf kinase inhibitor-like protein [Allonocardiopsis opalescens]|uniref:PBP family phospholipid-binding protein n=1 Tax=Allonocardiopsis opalescens TaxID=1144618 RepID=A0A2T0PYX7_9ACTN|nr:YbhB/YbcL family Raf kinase inhibitor-like protein [Allonocardiopsis opalescens]PRX96756.1 PBP family phospholipid-binding protein [Allonocardiopsis opalescens]